MAVIYLTDYRAIVTSVKEWRTCKIQHDIWIQHRDLHPCRCSSSPVPPKKVADLHKGYFWCCATLMMLTAIAFPHHSHKGQTEREGCVSKACPLGSDWSALGHSGWWGPQNYSTGSLFQTREALNFFTSPSQLRRGGRGTKERGGHGLGFMHKGLKK